MEDVGLPRQGTAPNPEGPLTLPLLRNPVLLPQCLLMALAV